MLSFFKVDHCSAVEQSILTTFLKCIIFNSDTDLGFRGLNHIIGHGHWPAFVQSAKQYTFML